MSTEAAKAEVILCTALVILHNYNELFGKSHFLNLFLWYDIQTELFTKIAQHSAVQIVGVRMKVEGPLLKLQLLLKTDFTQITNIIFCNALKVSSHDNSFGLI